MAYDGLLSGTVRPRHEISGTPVFADDTPLPTLERGLGRTREGRLWGYAADDRASLRRGPPAVAYVYARDRKAAPRQKRTAVIVRVPRGFNDTVLWPEFLELDRALSAHLQSVTTRIIHDAIHTDTSEVEEVQASFPGM